MDFYPFVAHGGHFVVDGVPLSVLSVGNFEFVLGLIFGDGLNAVLLLRF